MPKLVLESAHRFLVYAPPDQKAAAERFLRSVQTEFPSKIVESYGSFGGFKRRLRIPISSKVIAILIPADQRDLRNLVNLSGLVNGFPVVILLSDSSPQSTAIAHQLRPRFLSFIDENPASVVAVIDRLLGASRNR